MENLKIEKIKQEDELNKVKSDLHNVQEKLNFLEKDKELLEKKYITELNENRRYKEKEKIYEERSMNYYLSLEENKKKIVKLYIFLKLYIEI